MQLIKRKTLTKEEIKELYERFQNGDLKARNFLIEANIGLVNCIAKRYQGKGFEFEELINIGCIGLIKGIDNYDVTQPTKLSTYIRRCIMNEIINFLKKNNRVKTLSYNAGIKYNDIKKEGIFYEDIISDETKDPCKKYIKKEEKQLLYEILSKLKPKEQQLIIWRYGLGNTRRMMQREIALIMGCSRPKISRDEKKILTKIRNMKQINYLK